jgi:uncharacterized protein YuzE
MVKIDSIDGVVNGRFRFHFDIFADVLYIRLLSAVNTASVGDLTDEGDILLRDEKTDAVVGLTIVSWWKRFGQGDLPDSIAEIQKHIEPLATKVAA